MRTRIRAALALLLIPVAFAAAESKSLTVLGKKLDGHPPAEMMYHYLMAEVNRADKRWREEFEKRTTDEQIAANNKRLREEFLKALGPFPSRTPLEAKVTGVVKRKGYRVEKVLFQSRPRFHVTAALFLPDAKIHKPPYPGVLVPCGHAHSAKAHDTYQTVGALMALSGMAALVFDPIDQGERIQLLDASGKEVMWGTSGHTNLGAGCILLGLNTASYEIWDSMRALDYLQSRPEVDPKRLGCTGNSGGGTQTSQVMALEERIKAAAPSCYLNRLARQVDNSPGDAEQNIFGQLAWGMEHADYITMRAPRPVLILAATKDFFDIRATWETFRFAKRIYTRLGFAERVDLLENPAGHNYNKVQREGAARWMSRWLRGVDEAIAEPRIELIGEKELRATPRGQVMFLKGARNAYEINEEYDRKLGPKRRDLWAKTPRPEILGRIRKLAGIRELALLPKPKVQKTTQIPRDGYRVQKLIIAPEGGIYLPALHFVPDKPDAKAAPVLYVDSRGKATDAGPAGPIEKLIRDGHTVLAVDLRGWGETRKTRGRKMGAGGPDWPEYYKAYNLGRSYVGMRAEDVLVAARHLAGTTASARPRGGKPPAVVLVAVAHAGVPALHAAALEPELFVSVRLRLALASWGHVLRSRRPANQLQNTVHAALTTYDLPDLAATLGKKLLLTQPVDAEGALVKPKP